MSRAQFLESERESILSRMQASRDEYRRIMTDEPGGAYVPERTVSRDPRLHAAELTDSSSSSGSRHVQRFSASLADPSQRAHPYKTAANNAAMAAVGWVKEHPLLCAAAVAAVVVIGPRRVARSTVAGTSALLALTLRNPQNIDTVTRLISTAAAYVQRGRSR
ncbi:hypothetical protein D3870_12395 [Noviherbaspirillum cavernae]|uniref:Uncharacterized protein n=1 Tax=Noviherbaspirillum cavernae TaxID=2320862 RepID=A0A418X2L0_9BURK|nr:hypothetical protein [Noviherbaspirillum cavernae]RJG06702.1 hypothetical protein D3870_12395 [Noviherbaspirillum cavernae]